MKGRNRVFVASTLVLALTIAASSHLVASSPAPGLDGKAAFARLQNLAGDWEGTAGGGAGTVQYRLSANGTVVMETLFPGTSHEMISMYYLESGNLVLTHYCAMGNQPHMKLDLAASTADELHFAFAGGTNFDPAKDVHIHEGRITFKDDDHIESEWAVFKDGKKLTSHQFAVARKK